MPEEEETGEPGLWFESSPDKRAEARELALNPTASMTEVASLDMHRKHLENQAFADEMGLRKTYAIRLLWGLGAQMVVVDAIFFGVCCGEHWRVGFETMDAWFTATVVEIVGVVLVVTKFLFPPRGK